ncbi:MAG: ABC transporter permease [Pyrinomonadaceae bacterium]|nr:ABC transporter permease [Pyrinomonadaceae bacterium]
MLNLLASRVAEGIVVLIVVSAMTFGLLATAGGDSLTALRNDPLVSAETLNSLERIYGLDQPLHVRYWHWLTNAARGRLGESLYYHAPVSRIILPRLLATLALALVALIIAVCVALALGAAATRRRGGWSDRVSSVVVLFGTSTPRIVLALLALALLARTALFAKGEQNFWSGAALLRVLVPALVLSVPLVALFLSQARDGLRAAMNEAFVQVARAKGLPERTVILRHALRSALNPLITIFGTSLGGIMSGSVVVETVLDYAGLGQLSVVAIRNRDVPLLMSVVVLSATAVLVGNLVGDVLLRLNDPRLRQSAARSSFLKTITPPSS